MSVAADGHPNTCHLREAAITQGVLEAATWHSGPAQVRRGKQSDRPVTILAAVIETTDAGGGWLQGAEIRGNLADLGALGTDITDRVGQSSDGDGADVLALCCRCHLASVVGAGAMVTSDR